jgi:hypothetical protein
MKLLGVKGSDGNLGTTQNFALGEIFFSSNMASMSDLHISTFVLFVNTESVNVDPVPDAVNRLLLWTRKKPLSCLVYPNPSVFL